MLLPGFQQSHAARRRRANILRVVGRAGVPLIFLAIVALVAHQTLNGRALDKSLGHQVGIRIQAQFILDQVQDAEAGQRGFLLTGQSKYLGPYNAALASLPAAFTRLKFLIGNDAQAAPLAVRIEVDTAEKIAEMANTVRLQLAGQHAAAVAIVSDNSGLWMMAQLQTDVGAILNLQQRRIRALGDEKTVGFNQTIFAVSAMLGLVALYAVFSTLAMVAGIRERDASMRQLSAATEAAEMAKRAAEQASHAKSEFLASMSHELRTPLNAILGFTEIIKVELYGPVGHPKYLEYASDVYKSGVHLLDLINDVLDLSKIDAGKMELRESEFQLAELVSDAIKLVRNQADGKAGIVVRVSGRLAPIYADKRLIKQILINLLSNAIKFTPAGGTITIGAEDQPGQGIQLYVADTGVGMTPEQVEKAFSQYGQIDSKVARAHKGTGLGLPISRSLAMLHGGDLQAQSALGSGTCMTLSLPENRILRSKMQLAG